MIRVDRLKTNDAITEKRIAFGAWRTLQTIPTPIATPDDRLRALIAASGLSSAKYAEQVMGRNARTVRYWLSGTYPIPEVVCRWIEAQSAKQTP